MRTHLNHTARNSMGAVCCSADDAGSATQSNNSGKRNKKKNGNRLGGTGEDGLSARERAAAAAEKRQENSMGGNTETKNRAARDQLIGRIEAMYAAKNQDPPFGLRAASLQALKKHMKTAKDL